MTTHYLLTITESLGRLVDELMVKFATGAASDQVAIETLLLKITAEKQKLIDGIKALQTAANDPVKVDP